MQKLIHSIMIKGLKINHIILRIISLGMVYLFLLVLRQSFYCDLVAIFSLNYWFFGNEVCLGMLTASDTLRQALFWFLFTLWAVYWTIYQKSKDVKKETTELIYYGLLLAVMYFSFIISSVIFKIFANSPWIYWLIKYIFLVLVFYLVYIQSLYILWTIWSGLSRTIKKIRENREQNT